MLQLQTLCAVMLQLLFIGSRLSMIYKLDMPDGLQGYFNGAKKTHNISDITGEQIFWECMQRAMWQMAEQMGHNVTHETRDYLFRLLQIAVDTRESQIPRIRKEYRMLTDEERDKFHKSIQDLKADTALKPNVYTAFAEIHAGDVIPMAHFGAGFLGWHRVFLLIFETALRLKDPSVSLPYWASNLDSEMEEPTKSIIWSDKFLGNGDGFVNNGPFADFKVHSSDSILTRNIGSSGSLMTNEGIHGILSQNYTKDITSPSAPHAQNIELQHNTVHLWVGGNMDDLSTSGEDPVFFVHHSFIDYLWEEFRTKQKMMGIDPETDYPKENWGTNEHAPDAALGFGDLRNVDAFSNFLADLVKYDPSPVCSRSHPTCVSKYLRCESIRSQPICVSLSREEVEGVVENETDICVEAHLMRAVQNSFALNQHCDIRKWSYIPVKIILQRPPEFMNYKAYPVLNNKPDMTNDVFSTIDVNKTISKNIASYPKCKTTNSVARKIYVESYGLNYYGKYKDFTILDQRHALSEVIAYLGVKSPETNFTEVIVYAFDYCGRTCRPFCLDASLSPPKYTPCSGVIRVTSEEPKLYGNSYAEAMNSIWSAQHPDDLPESQHHQIFITFYCDYSGVWPWDKEIQIKLHNIQKATKEDTTKPVRPQAQETALHESIISRHVIPTNVGTQQRSHMTRQSNNPTQERSFQARNSARGILNNISRQNLTWIPERNHVSTRVPSRMLIDLSSAAGRTSSVRRTLATITNNSGSVHRNILSPTRSASQQPFFSNILLNDGPNARRLAPLRTHVLSKDDPRHVQEGCQLNSGCYLSVPCSPCRPISRQRCRAPSQLVAICANGIYELQSMVFNTIG